MSPKPPAIMQSSPWQDEFANRLAERYGAAISEFSTYLGQNFIVAERESVPAIVTYLKATEGFEYLVDLTAVHYPSREKPFELIYILYSYGKNERLRVKTLISEGQKPQSVVGIYLGANWLERECYDMFGIEFAGHPDLRRILLPEDWRGFPLRKDYGILDMDNRWVNEHLGIESGQ
jgi:NADH-quinone oxidoreductase subunit C